ncbi:MAG TPA: SUMF1/EgtB/PvdO family nonheme iron enzyme [Myxococcota bacterium]
MFPASASLIDHVVVPAGSIVLHDEGTRRSWRVDVDRFVLSTTPVARAQYLGTDDARPMTDVSWIDAVRFCNALSLCEGLQPVYVGVADDEVAVDVDAARMHVVTGNGWRLPSEAEWEHATRAGGNDVRHGVLDDIAWHRGNSGDVVHEVALKAANAWGLFDTIGNVWEWCDDVFDPKRYGTYRVFRGGGFADLPHACRASCRRKSHPKYRADDVGFRLARSL